MKEVDGRSQTKAGNLTPLEHWESANDFSLINSTIRISLIDDDRRAARGQTQQFPNDI